ncbi:MAG TPA: DUF2934 domain-containing protein [Syntrophorhabdaceae bacterium]|nr:DUF2934 domain-containing protein [Syntrophorhabdaceae bacterium]HOL06084.1 DUF2934 domain-containing protein [Syntrophorhabdaceae bacterium]HON85970.1 DUF2934 domain-containing protein [Syntrophorhabdaceae bacterium]HOT42518.1 DUF2934 domain-containing protein [Syntrophorhabdaceae bacterium]HPP42532.1 DUF2934 domain-containing protein [Syntrophorhabdaceae bacterium]
MDLYDEIARLAYEMFEREGRVHGRHLEHWFEAERIVISRYRSQEADIENTQEKQAEEPKKKKPAAKKAREGAAKKTRTVKASEKKTETSKQRGKKKTD